MNKQFLLLFFATTMATAGYEGLPKTQWLEKKFRFNLSHYDNWMRRIDGGTRHTPANALKQQYEFLAEGVDRVEYYCINQVIATNQQEKIENIDSRVVESFMPSYEYWESIAGKLLEACAQSERRAIEANSQQP